VCHVSAELRGRSPGNCFPQLGPRFFVITGEAVTSQRKGIINRMFFNDFLRWFDTIKSPNVFPSYLSLLFIDRMRLKPLLFSFFNANSDARKL
jgi:hypothetical protein